MSSFRQIDQRHVSSEIALMEWSPTMDLIALATVQGEILLHRLSWQKVWSLPSIGTKEKEVKITAIAWRPDGKVLAFAYDTGKVALADVENADALHVLDIHCIVTSLHWVGSTAPQKEAEESIFYNDRSSLFLPKFYSVSKTYGSSNKQVEETCDDSKKLKNQNRLNILTVGNENGVVQLYAFGMFPCGYIDVFDASCNTNHKKVISVALSEDFSLLTAILETRDEEEKVSYYFKSFNVPLLQKKTEEIKVVALKYGQIASLLTYLSSTIRSISEAWEDILLEIDTKLLNYAEEKKRVSEGTISDDFLELLMFGTPSDALEKFLLHDLTENGLKKFGHSIELSYSNIQKLVLKKLQNVATSLFYHLSDLKGMTFWKERFGELGLSHEAVNDALSSVGSFLMKATEIQQVIDSSMKNFKAFFRWLYAVILRLSDEPLPAEITKATQQDLNFVAEFLKENFTSEWDQDSKSTFKLERVGQYLKNENIPFPPVITGNPWVKFLNENPSLRESNTIFPYYPEKSLVQQHAEVRKMIEIANNGLWNIFQNSVSTRSSYILFKSDNIIALKVSHSTSLKNGFITTVFTNESLPSTYLHVVRESLSNSQKIEAVSFSFGTLHNASGDASSEKCSKHKVFDAKFYNEDTISVLLVETENPQSQSHCPILVQLALKCLQEKMKQVIVAYDGSICSNVPIVEGGLFVDKASYRRLENIKAVQLSVSGSRKVACVLFASRRQVRLFEMDVEDDDEDLDETDHEDSIMKDCSDRDQSIGDHISENDMKNKENSF